ncbi:MAG TPA: PspC domain-containing protein, partial [Herpetosiphonaceae bacterium]
MSNHLQTPLSQRLTRSSTDRRIAGVCGGLGQYFGLDPIIVRFGFLALAFFAGVGFILYPIMWLVMPRDTTQGTQNWGQGFQEMRDHVQQVASGLHGAVKPGAGAQFDPMTGRPLNTEAPRFDPYTGQPIPMNVANVGETAVPITNAGPSAGSAPSGVPANVQERRKRFLGMALMGAGILAVSNIVFD